jgi:DNA-binding transcriptional LysR family regulator
MDDLNDLAFFAAVVRHRGFSAAARATGVEKTRLSRRVAELERRLGVRLLQRTTRSIALTEAGRRFYDHCQAVVGDAQSAYDSIADLRREPAGTIRMCCPQPLAHAYLTPILPDYLARHPKVKLVLDTTYRLVNLIEEGVDLAVRARHEIEEPPGLVARRLGSGEPVLVASPEFLNRQGRPRTPDDLVRLDCLVRPQDVHDDSARWMLTRENGEKAVARLCSRLESEDLVLLLEAALNGLGVAMLPARTVANAVRAGALEHVLPEWSGAKYAIFLLYPRPRGMLPSVRSLIDYLSSNLIADARSGDD